MADEAGEGSSPTPETDQVTDANPAQSSSADSPDANGAPQPEAKSLLDVLKDVVQPAAAKEPEPEASSTSEGKTEPTAEPAKGADDDPPFHTHPRWQALKAERDQLRGPAEQYSRIEGFLRTNQLSPDEFVQGCRLMALMKNDPGKAWDALYQHLDQLGQAIGLKLPKDLQEKVDGGYVDEGTARETARLRAETERRQAAEARQSEERAREATERAAGEIVAAVNAWEVGIQKADPDYPKLKGLVMDRVRAIAQETGRTPRTPAEGREMAEQAYRDVRASLAPLRPNVTPIRRAPLSAGMSATASAAPAKSLREALDRAVGR